MAAIVDDIRYSLRSLRNSPLFSVIAVVTLALGIGATSTLFTIVDAVVLRPLPYRDASRILSVSEARGGDDRHVVPSDAIVAWTASARTIASLAAYSGNSVTLTGAGDPVQLSGTRVTGNFFPLLGVRALVGRTLQPGDESQDVVVLSEGLWRERFGGDRAIVNRSIVLGGKPLTVVGVVSAAVAYPRSAALWVPFDVRAPGASNTVFYYSVLARPRPGVSDAAVHADLAALVRRGDPARPAAVRGADVKVMTLHDRMFGEVQRPLALLFTAVGFLMLIACANVANLLLARGAARRRGMAVRAALGASPGRLMRLVLVECTLLALAGAAVGVLVPVWSIAAFVHLSPDVIARAANVQVNTRVLAFAAVLGISTGLVFGAGPAWFGRSTDLLEPLRAGGARSGGSPAQQRFRRALVAAQLAVALLLLTGAGLLTRSFVRAAGVNPGFEPEHLATAWVNLPSARYSNDPARDAFFDRLVERVRPLPGVVAVALADAAPPGGMTMSVAAKALVGGENPADIAIVTASRDYARTIGLQLVAGRDLDATDAPGAPVSVLLSNGAARLLFGGRRALGQTINATGIVGNPARATVVGIVGDVPEPGSDATPMPRAYFAREQVGGGQSIVVIRFAGDGDGAALHRMLQREVGLIDPLQPIATFDVVSSSMARAVAPRRLGFLVVAVFAGIALLLAALGLYGVTAFQVTERTREIGVRVALGATGRSVRSLIVVQGFRVVAAGCAIGLGLSFVLTRLLAGMLFGIGVHDPLTFVIAPGALIVVALFACYVPARRASRLDPVEALRTE